MLNFLNKLSIVWQYIFAVAEILTFLHYKNLRSPKAKLSFLLRTMQSKLKRRAFVIHS